MKKFLILIISVFLLFGCKDKQTPIDYQEGPVAGVCDMSEPSFDEELAELSAGVKVEYIAVHCDALPENVTWDAKRLTEFFLVDKGWARVGYWLYITRDGKVWALINNKLDCYNTYSEITYGVSGYNYKTLNICYSGGVDKYGKPADTRTKEQKLSIQNVINVIKSSCPDVKVQSHRDFPGVNKACPSFDATKEYR